MAQQTKLFGQIIHIGKEEIFGENGFKKREVYLQTIEQYPNCFNIEFTQSKCDLLNDFKIGDNVSINYNLKGRKYTKNDGATAVFNSVVGWAIENLETETPNSAVEQYQNQNPIP